MSVSVNSAIAAVKGLLDSNGWRYDFNAEKNYFNVKFNLSKTKLGSVSIMIRVRPRSAEPSECFAIYSYGNVSLKADADCMAQVCEYLTRANYGLVMGNFEMDHTDGEIRYKVSMNARDTLPGEDALDDLVALPVSMFNKYGNGLLAVAMGMQSPEEAIKKAEA